MMIKNQCYGVEIEMTGITRAEAATVIATYYGTATASIGDYYDSYIARDSKGRKWKAMSDGSINTQRKVGNRKVAAGRSYSCEVVTPILQYEDLEDLQNLVRALREAGAFVNSSCGIHVHVDGANHTPESLSRLLNFAVGRQDLIYEALQIGDREFRWCHKISPALFKAMKNDQVKTKASTEQLWYSSVNDDYRGGIDHQHYNSTRYHGINLHAYFTKGTVEFRLFNGTLHAGKIKAYVQFCLAMSGWAIEAKSDRLYFKGCGDYTMAQKETLMTNVLIHRLGMSGPEFKTARQHLTAAFRPAENTTAA